MAKSILQNDYSVCFLCGRNGYSDPLEEHHIFGASNRKHSEADGLKVRLCGRECHRNGKESAHRNKAISDGLKKMAERAWINTYGSLDEFMCRYGKNYIQEDTDEQIQQS